MSSPHLKALADAVVTARGKLRLSQRELAAKAGVTLDTVQAIEGAKRNTFRPKTKASFEDALNWQSGDFNHVLEHGRFPERRPEQQRLLPGGVVPSKERIAAMSREQVLAIADLIREATGSMEQAVAFIDGADRVRREAQRPGQRHTG